MSESSIKRRLHTCKYRGFTSTCKTLVTPKHRQDVAGKSVLCWTKETTIPEGSPEERVKPKHGLESQSIIKIKTCVTRCMVVMRRVRPYIYRVLLSAQMSTDPKHTTRATRVLLKAKKRKSQ